ncbi:MAG: nodulation protein NfeD [Chloroflexota bacterium]
MLATCIALRDGIRWHRLLGVVLLLIGLSSVLSPVARSQDAPGGVYVVQVHGEIDLGLAPYLARILEDAERNDAAAVILDINTPGGRLDAALQMRQSLLETPVRTIAFVNRDAFSAGALIALAANEIYMTPGAVLGAATPVTGNGQTASPKTISAVRSTFKSTAETRGRDPQLAEAMVDPSVTVEGLDGSDQLLTLTTADARARGFVDGVAASRQELLQAAGLDGAAIHNTAPALAEHLVRIITNPMIAALLVAAGLLLVLTDLFGGGIGVGFPAAVGISLMGVFFWGHMLAGLAGWEGVVLVGVGLVLLALEAFVIPGFGLAGILGILAFAAGLFVSLIGGEIVTSADIVRAATTVTAALVGLVLGGAALLWLLIRTDKTGGIVLQTRLGLADGNLRLPAMTRRRTTEPASLRGAHGVADSDLRPAGYARINGRRVDVVTRGDYLPAGTVLEVVQDDGYRRVVRRFEASQGEATRPRARSLA